MSDAAAGCWSGRTSSPASPRSRAGSRARSRRRRSRRRWRGCASGWRPPGWRPAATRSATSPGAAGPGPRAAASARTWTRSPTPAATTASSACWSGSPSSRRCRRAARARRVRRRGGPALPERRSSAAARSSAGSSPTSSSCATRRASRSREAIGATARRAARIEGARAYFEVHIEQGPVLEAAGAPLGVVTAIAGQTRFNLAFEGHAGHAGTTPMDLRRDALGAAAEFVLAAERLARDDARAGRDGRRDRHPARRVQRDPGPRRGDARHPPPGRRRPRARDRAPCATRRGDRRAAAGSRELVADRRARRDALHARRSSRGSPRRSPSSASPVLELPSGAGHDAVTMAGVTDVAMLFVRCAGRHQPPPGRGRRRRPTSRSPSTPPCASSRAPGARADGACDDLIVRGGRVVTPAGVVDGRRRHRRRRDRRGRAGAPGGRRGDRRDRPARASPAGSTRTCTSTSPAARTGRAWRPAARRSPRGGFTAFFDMPLNSTPADDRRGRLRREARGGAGAARASTSACGAGSCPATVDRLEELAERGVIGFKAFMSNSGIDEFRHADDATLYDGMAEARAARAARRRARRERRADRRARAARRARDFMASRPVIAELEAIARAIAFAEDTGCALHIVHVSSAAAGSRWSPRRACAAST